MTHEERLQFHALEEASRRNFVLKQKNFNYREHLDELDKIIYDQLVVKFVRYELENTKVLGN